MLMMSFDDALTHANFSFVYFLQFSEISWHFSMGGLKPPNPTLATPLPPTVQLTVTTDTGMKGETVETAAKLQSVHDPAAPLNDTVQRSNSHCITEGSEHWFIICTPTWTHHYCFQYIRLLTTKCNIEMLCLLYFKAIIIIIIITIIVIIIQTFLTRTASANILNLRHKIIHKKNVVKRCKTTRDANFWPWCLRWVCRLDAASVESSWRVVAGREEVATGRDGLRRRQCRRRHQQAWCHCRRHRHHWRRQTCCQKTSTKAALCPSVSGLQSAQRPWELDCVLSKQPQ